MKFSTDAGISVQDIGRAPQGARGLKFPLKYWPVRHLAARRAPQGARGLKSRKSNSFARNCKSRPARGAWIEMMLCEKANPATRSRPARGAWIEIASKAKAATCWGSRPARGAWIEIQVARMSLNGTWSRPARGAWIEIISTYNGFVWYKSRPARGAWIEIRRNAARNSGRNGRAPQGARGLKFIIDEAQLLFNAVAPRKGRVD